ncbi:MAG TPA: c-type cytochrome [Planctomycetes bacterium]|nr:c-type cytochrome [Planctomycetota bacterium]
MHPESDKMQRSFIYLILLTSLVVYTPDQLRAVDEQESLALLVETLDTIDDPAVQTALLQGMLNGLDGRRNVPAPAAWLKVGAKLAKSDNPQVRELVSRLSQIFGDEAAMQRALATVQDRSSQLDARRRALHSLLNQKNKGVSALLEQLLDEPELRLDAIRGYAAIENERAPEILLPRYVKWTSEHRQAIIETLATRRKYAESLLAAIKAKKIPIADIPSHVARSLSLILGDSFVEVYGDVRQLSVDRTKQINKYKELLSSTAFANADPSRGRLIFKETCAACHVLYGTGGKIGPDLTGSNRANLDYILLNSIDPSYDVPQGYKMVIIHTVDGRVLNGVIAEENAQRIILKTVQQPTVVILKSDIEARKISPKSMMPDGQLDKLKPQEVMNLIKYLQTTEQVELAQ